MTNWIDIAALADVPKRGARLVKTAHGCVAVFRTGADEVFALDNACPHKNGPLAEGIVHGKAVTCPLHNWVISTGCRLFAPKGGCMTLTRTTCPYCGVGCGVLAGADGTIKGDPDHPANFGRRR